MARDISRPPRERVNITYKANVGDGQEEVELPLKVLAIADYLGRQDERPMEDRAPVDVNKDNFNDVMKEQKLSLDVQVEDRLSGEDGAELNVGLSFESLADFSPDRIAEQVPELRHLLQLRQALTALKGPLGNIPTFRKRLQGLLDDEEGRKKLMSELGIELDKDE